MHKNSTSPLSPVEGKYEIVAKISEGGMGAVYRVRHRLLDGIRVVKVLRPHHSDNLELRARFIAEARNAIRMRHPNIVEIHDFTLSEDGTGLIVMEHIDGVDLRSLRTGSPPSLALLLEIAQQTLRALGYLHRLGFVHRDISPDNLMLTTDTDNRPLVKLIDLGIAKDRRSGVNLTEVGFFLGKFRYASPEHFSAEDTSAIGPASDLYALAVVLYELATGIHPIVGDDAAALIAGHLFRAPRAFAETDSDGKVPPALREVLMRCLAKRPEERYPDAETMQGELEPLRQAFPVDDAVVAEAAHRIRARPEAEAKAVPGSTQERLDAELALTATAAPGSQPLEATVAAASGPPMPGDDPFDRCLAHGCAHAADGDFARAADAFARALALRPESMLVRLLLEEAKSDARRVADGDTG